MKSMFPGHFRPTEVEYHELWSNCIFAIDANVLLNLYRYSSTTRLELEKALTLIQARIFIPHQAAKEFLKNRLGVTSGQAIEYTTAIKTISGLLTTLSSNKRHPFLPDAELPKFSEFAQGLICQLEAQRDTLLAKLTNDEILDFVAKLFTSKTGAQYDEATLQAIEIEGAIRYQNSVPPGYKDAKKGDADDPYRKYGDLIIWKQMIDKSKDESKPLIFITDDKKEDWWLDQSGRTIGPCTELSNEFLSNTNQRFWMYTVDKFIEESARINNVTVSKDVIKEIIEISEYEKLEIIDEKPAIELIQTETVASKFSQEGYLKIQINKSMKNATGTGKFHPNFDSVPNFDIKLIDSPYENSNLIKIRCGVGTTRNFNVHIIGIGANLLPGEYFFEYKAEEKEITDQKEITELF